MNTLLHLAEAFIVAFIMLNISNRLKVPSVSGFVIGGVLLGGSVFYWLPGAREFTNHWLFSAEILDQFTIITQIALGLISISIGTELEFKRLKTLGAAIVAIAFTEALSAFVLVTVVVSLLFHNFPLGLILGAVSSATAPAATVAVIQQYRAKGPLTSTILAVVGLDDAISFMIFAFALAITKAQLAGGSFDVFQGLVMPIGHILMALTIGSVIGFSGSLILRRIRDHDATVFLLLSIVFLVAGIASAFSVSELLANMAAGMVIVNFHPAMKNRIRHSFGAFVPVFYALFFIAGGAHLNIFYLPTIWVLAIVYFMTRSMGKISGATLGAAIGRAPVQVRKNVGFTLLPQVGAAVALALVVQHELGNGDFGDAGKNLAEATINVLLVTTLLTEFIGPYLTKQSLFKAGEAER